MGDGPRVAVQEVHLGAEGVVDAYIYLPRQMDIRLSRKQEFKLPWRKAGPSNHLDDKVDSDQ